MLTHVIREIFRTNLGVKRGEKVLVFTDRPTSRDGIDDQDRQRWKRLRDVVNLVYETGRGFTDKCMFYEYPSRGGHGKEPPEGLWRVAFGEKTISRLKEERLLTPLIKKRVTAPARLKVEEIIRRRKRAAVDAVVALSNYSTSHTMFRKLLTDICGARYASMPLFDVAMFEGAMGVDWRQLAARTKRIAKLVRKAVAVTIKTPSGTDLTLSKKRRKTFEDNGVLKKPGSFGNLPAGEVFFAPIEGSARGRLVLEWAPTRPMKSPIVLEVEDGKVISVSGDDEYGDVLLEKFNERDENRNIAEVGIGTNERAKRPDNILESEKILGTVHIALGDNSSFGGRVSTPFHQDFVLFKPTLMLHLKNGGVVELIKEGGYMEGIL